MGRPKKKQDQAGHYCEKCHQVLAPNEFYRSNNLEKYPDRGLLNQCKKCITMHVDNWNPDTYMWILQECDVPYIPDKWADILIKNSKDADKITGATILGKYLSLMHIKQYQDYRWADTEILQEIADAKQEQAMKKNGYTAAQIAIALEQGRRELPPKPEPKKAESTHEDEDEEMMEMVASLTDDDRHMLRIKWGNSYTPSEWIQLEKLWTEMENSYDIQTAGHRDTLKMLCKTSLKANQLLDMNDIEGFQRLQKAYDSLMKSGNFKKWSMKNFSSLLLGF